ncbi:MAG: glycoside hydrolase family 15 protein [Thermoplasmata archaeon]|nr:glycoside hydrolase family 15 protein [Thermoplasmata archaeon]
MITQLTGNGRLLLTLNSDGQWGSLFYPYAGQFQHLRETRLGVFEVATGQFSWLKGGLGFELVPTNGVQGNASQSTWKGRGIEVRATDHVHPNHDLIVRVIRVRADPARELRLFAYQSLNIAESMFQDTAYLDLAKQVLVHYKRGYYFHFFSYPNFSKAVCGEHTVKGLQGSYVDSVLEWDITAGPTNDTTIRLFVALGTSHESAHRIREYVRSGDPSRFEREAMAFWKSWAGHHYSRQVPKELSERAGDLYQRSVFVMRNVASSNGAIVASPDISSLLSGGDTYNYCWWRDGGYVAKAMDEAGLSENADRFLSFAARCQGPNGYWVHRHFPDGEVGSTWHPPPFLQIDQTGTVVAAVWHHYKRFGDLDRLLEFWPMVKSAANFLSSFRDGTTGLPAPSFDLWEETNGIHTYSTAVVAHALERAARIALELGKDPVRWRAASLDIHQAALQQLWDPTTNRFLRSFQPRDTRLDASLLLALKHGLLEWKDPRAKVVVDAVEKRLWSPTIGGLARYEGDQYYGPENPWIICTLWLAEARLSLGEVDRTRELIEWVAQRATPTLLLPEQVDAKTGEVRSATPLTWSHSTFVDVVNKYRRVVSGARPLDE